MAKQLPLHMYWIVNGLYAQECWEETVQLFSIRQHNQVTIKKNDTFNNPILAKKEKRVEKLLHVIVCLDLLEQTFQLLLKLTKIKEYVRKVDEYFFLRISTTTTKTIYLSIWWKSIMVLHIK